MSKHPEPIEWRDGNMEYDKRDHRVSVVVEKPFYVGGEYLVVGRTVTNVPNSEAKALERRCLAKRA